MLKKIMLEKILHCKEMHQINVDCYKQNMLDILTGVAWKELRIDIVVENENLHHISYAEKSYAVYGSNVNDVCEPLQYNKRIE